MLLFGLACALFLAFEGHGNAQSASAGQARSFEEFDGYLLVLAQTSPKEVISAAKRFERQWPHSELLAEVFELELEAYRSLGDSNSAIAAGEEALKRAADNLAALANVGYILANSTSDARQLGRAEAYARRELELSKAIRVPKSILPEEWEEIQGHLGSTAHATLGLVAYKRGDLGGAIREFELAIQGGPAPDPVHYYRLGRLYQATGNEPAAIHMLQRAAESSDRDIRQLAERELQSMRRRSRHE